MEGATLAVAQFSSAKSLEHRPGDKSDFSRSLYSVRKLEKIVFMESSSCNIQYTSPDPVRGNLGNPLSWNRYTYCHNNPIMYTDPTGKAPFIGDQLDMGYNSPTQSIGTEGDYVSWKTRNNESQPGHVIFTWEGGGEGNLFFLDGSLGYMLFMDPNADPWYNSAGIGIYTKKGVSIPNPADTIAKKCKVASAYVYGGPGFVSGANSIEEATEGYSMYSNVDLQILSAETCFSEDGRTTSYSLTAGYSWGGNLDIDTGRIDFHFVVTSGQVVDASITLYNDLVNDPYNEVMRLTPAQWCEWITGYNPVSYSCVR